MIGVRERRKEGGIQETDHMRQGAEDGRQGAGRETGDRGQDTKNRDVRLRHRMGDKVQRLERGDKGLKTGTGEGYR